jgi:transcription elongation factor GreA
VVDGTRRTAGAVDLLRSVGLLADGPVRWGSPVRSTRPGVYLIELPEPLPRAPIDLSPVGTWIERVPTLELDGHRPTGKELAQRLGGFWLADQVVLYVGSTDGSIGRRIDELVRTPLGDPAPYPDGRWLKTLRGLEQARVWWAETDAPEEYEDALLEAFAAAVDPASVETLHDPTVVVPFANMAIPTGLTKDHGITGDLRTVPAEPAPPEQRRLVTLPPGKAVASEHPMAPRSRATGGASRTTGRPSAPSRMGGATDGTSTGSGQASDRAGDPSAGSGQASGRAGHPSAASGQASGRAAPRPSPRRPTPSSGARSPLTSSSLEAAARPRRAGTPLPTSPRQAAPTHVTAEGLARLKEELTELVQVRRPEIIARVRAARELGDLSENADYEAARKEQSFAEGRIAQLEAMIRTASIIEAPAQSDAVVLGSTVVVESSEGLETYTIVGSSEARPAEGRISNTSPLGQALLGRRAGDDVVVRAPVGERHFRIVELR